MEQKSTVFATLSSIPIKDKVEKKNNLDYLSWAHAWAEVKKIYPSASYEIHKFEGGLPYVFDPKTGYMVFTSVTIEGVTHEMWLPVMDGANKAMKDIAYEYEAWAWQQGKKTKVVKEVEACSMFDINKTIMRCLAKNVAMHGLGLSLWTGEDLPDTAAAVAEPPEQPKVATIYELAVGDDNWANVLKYIAANKELGLDKIVANIERKYKMKAAVKKEIAKQLNA
jgi:hypothetical protein